MNRSHNHKWEEIFAEAAERVQAGEPVDGVLASYPHEYQQRLRDLLAIVGTAGELHHAPIPMPASHRRAANRQALLQAAAQKRTQVAPVTASVRSRPVVQEAIPTWPARLAAVWAGFQALFVPRTMRLAMTLAALIVLVLGSTTLVSAQSAIPGDLTYPVKQWIRSQQLALTSPDQFSTVSKAQEIEVKSDVQKAQEQADLRKTVISARVVLVFYGFAGQYMEIGSLHVLPRYQPDPNQPSMKDMTQSGTPVSGAIVLLEYQIIPGLAIAANGPVVQGISLQVLKLQAPEPTIIPTFTALPALTDTSTPLPTDTATTEPPPATPIPTCTVGALSGTRPYNPATGDTLAAIAGQFGTSIEALRSINCLTTDEVVPGVLILVPDGGDGNTSATTPAPGLTRVPTDTVEATATMVAPTVVTTATLLPGPVTTDGLTATLTALPTAVLATVTPVNPPATPDTGLPTATPTPAATTTESVVTTPDVTATLNEGSTPTEGALPPTALETAAPPLATLLEVASPTDTSSPVEPATPLATEGSVTGAAVTAEPPPTMPDPPTPTPLPLPTAVPPVENTPEPPPITTPAA